jgi:hypothetical protein
VRGKLHAAFQQNKIKRYLEVHGESFTFSRHGENAYGEPNDQTTNIQLVGMFYTQNNQKGFWLVNEFEESNVRYKRYVTNFIIVDYDSFVLSPIYYGDEVLVNGKQYRVTGTTNIQEANFAVNISVEQILTPMKASDAQ